MCCEQVLNTALWVHGLRKGSALHVGKRLCASGIGWWLGSSSLFAFRVLPPPWGGCSKKGTTVSDCPKNSQPYLQGWAPVQDWLEPGVGLGSMGDGKGGFLFDLLFHESLGWKTAVGMLGGVQVLKQKRSETAWAYAGQRWVEWRGGIETKA